MFDDSAPPAHVVAITAPLSSGAAQRQMSSTADSRTSSGSRALPAAQVTSRNVDALTHPDRGRLEEAFQVVIHCGGYAREN